MTWLGRWGPLILSHHPAKFRVDRSCESEDVTFSNCQVTTISKCVWSPVILNHHLARYCVHRSHGTGNNGVWCISSNSKSNSISNSKAEVPMPRFTNGLFIIKKLAHINWDVIIPCSLRLLLKVWIWYRGQNFCGHSRAHKNYTQENVKWHIQHEDSWLRWIVIEQANYN